MGEKRARLAASDQIDTMRGGAYSSQRYSRGEEAPIRGFMQRRVGGITRTEGVVSEQMRPGPEAEEQKVMR